MYSSYTQFPPLITGRHGCKETFCSNYLQLSFSSIRQEPTRPCKLEEMIPHHGIIMSWSFYPIFCLASFCDMNHFYKVPGHPIVAGGTWQQSQTDFQLAGGRRQIWLLAIPCVRVMSSGEKHSHKSHCIIDNIPLNTQQIPFINSTNMFKLAQDGAT